MSMMPTPIVSLPPESKSAARSLKLLMITACFHPHVGGIETHVAEVGQRLAQRGHQVTVLTTRPDDTWPMHEPYRGMEIVRMRDWLAGRDAYLAPAMPNWIASGEWDLIHYQGCATLVPPITLFGTRWMQTPFVMTFHLGGHSSAWRTRFRATQWRIMRPLLRRARRFIAVSRYEARYFAEVLRVPTDAVAVIPNGIPDLTGFSLALVAREPGLILSIGRLERYKGHHRVIAALPHVISQLPEVRLEILGTGPYEVGLLALAHELGVADRVRIRYIPPDRRDELIRTLYQANLVTLLSESESHPIAIVEALACGCAALVGDTTGLRELGEDGLATSVASDAPAEMIAQSIISQLTHPHLPSCERLPTWDQCVDGLLSTYHQALKDRG